MNSSPQLSGRRSREVRVGGAGGRAGAGGGGQKPAELALHDVSGHIDNQIAIRAEITVPIVITLLNPAFSFLLDQRDCADLFGTDLSVQVLDREAESNPAGYLAPQVRRHPVHKTRRVKPVV